MAEEPKNPAARVRNKGLDWLRPTRAVSIAFDVRKVALAAVGLAAIQAGWFNLDQLSPGLATTVFPFVETPRLPSIISMDSPGLILGEAFANVARPALVFIAPLWEFFHARTDLGAASLALSKLALMVVVVGIVGGAIARSAVIEAARGERSSMAEGLRFAFQHGGTLIAAPLFPLLTAMLCGLIAAVFGLLLNLPGGVGEVVGGVGFVVPLALGFVAALLLINLAAAWPLIHASVAAEGEDALDALSRAFGCVNRRPVQFAALVALAWIVGSAGLIVVDLIAATALHLAVWGTSLTAPNLDGPPAFWTAIVAFLVQAWAYAYFWSSAALIYLTLRRDIDGSPWSEVTEP